LPTTLTALGLAIGSTGVASAAMPAGYVQASIRAIASAPCLLRKKSSAPGTGIAIMSDGAGYARFYALRTAPNNPAHAMILDCTDSNSINRAFPVDLAADTTFAQHPIVASISRSSIRPALAGDPMKRSQAELIKAGYGLRPDPTQSREAYERWLKAASRSARILPTHPGLKPLFTTKPHLRLPSARVVTTTEPNWVGATLTGDAIYTYTEATFNVPTAIPHGDGTGDAGISIWTGLDGNGGPPLIQTGAQVQTTGNAATYEIFREYCCGSPTSNNYVTPFSPNPGDTIFAESWYCDRNGNVSTTQHYGCTFLFDETSGGMLNCVQFSDPNCPSVQAQSSWTGFGQSADFIIELEVQPSFMEFTPDVIMAGSAYSKKRKKSVSIVNATTVNKLTDFTNSKQTVMGVVLGPKNDVDFHISSVKHHRKISARTDKQQKGSTIAN
jgi:hypothetical protein